MFSLVVSHHTFPEAVSLLSSVGGSQFMKSPTYARASLVRALIRCPLDVCQILDLGASYLGEGKRHVSTHAADHLARCSPWRAPMRGALSEVCVGLLGNPTPWRSRLRAESARRVRARAPALRRFGSQSTQIRRLDSLHCRTALHPSMSDTSTYLPT